MILAPRQTEAQQTLERLRIFSVLKEYDPVLAGTIPLGIDLPDSDLDVLCHARDLEAFLSDVHAAYGDRSEFQAERTLVGDRPTILARFRAEGFSIEIFAQDRPSREQDGYRHFIAEARLLELAGEPARRKVRQLREAGWKTEPAFAIWLGLDRDHPYQAVLELANWDDQALCRLISERGTEAESL